MSPLALLCIFAVLAPITQEENIEAILQRLEESSARLTSFEAGYSQCEIDEFGDSTVFNGTIYYLKDKSGGSEVGLFKMTSELDGRIIEEVCTNGRQGWMVRHSLKRVEVATMSAINRRVGGITLTGAADILRNNYDITLEGIDELASGRAYHLRCEPMEGAIDVDPTIDELELWINIEQPSPITKILLNHRDQVVSTWELNSVQRNADINRNIFQKRIPSGYTEIKHE